MSRGGSGRLDRRRALLAAPLAGFLLACAPRRSPDRESELVFRHPKLFGDPAPLDALIGAFTRDTGIAVRRETLPASSDEQHLFYAINLQARSTEFDVLALDVVWGAEFAAAGWLRDLSHLVDVRDRADFFPAPLAAGQWSGRTFALPWFVDAGLLYYRADLLEAAGRPVPATWSELFDTAGTIAARAPGIYGFVWQGKQYEGLVCNALEFVWSHGGGLPAGRAADRSIAGLAFMRSLVTAAVTPPQVATYTEEPSRVLFGQGRAVFLRNWPYAWRLLERPGSAVEGRVGVTALPGATGFAGATALGGWLLGVNAASPRTQEAERLVAHLAAAPAQQALAAAYGYSPARRSVYSDPAFAAAQPFVATLAKAFEQARARPVSPRYVALSQVLQAEFSAVLTGRRTPGAAVEAIGRAAQRIDDA
jgi:multiple sugar transport system substrate-binding protein